MPRKYNVEGTKSFLIAAIILLVLGLWHIKDGWFPSPEVMEKHVPGTDDTYYLYNKVTGVILTVAAAICGYVHRVVK